MPFIVLFFLNYLHWQYAEAGDTMCFASRFVSCGMVGTQLHSNNGKQEDKTGDCWAKEVPEQKQGMLQVQMKTCRVCGLTTETCTI